MNIFFITGSSGFIGFHLSKSLLESGETIIGIDNINDYYSTKLKEDRNKELGKYNNYYFYKADICDYEKLLSIYKKHNCNIIIHLAAQAGVRYSLINPLEYKRSNLDGFFNILEIANTIGCQKLIFASSSSVYGANTKIPFSVEDPVSKPVSFYGATKLANEIMAYSYHSLYNIPMVGLRFFTVYGPWGRPDMSYYKFASSIMNNKPIDVYNNGIMKRSFTYISDIIEGIISTLKLDSSFYIFNLGNPESVDLMYFIECIENSLGKKAVYNLLPMQSGDMVSTVADIEFSKKVLGYSPKVRIEKGIPDFIKWFSAYHKHDTI